MRAAPAFPETLFELVYVSRRTARTGPERAADAAAILAAAARRNPALGITGALGAAGGWYAQVLEGPRGALVDVYERILGDPRHDDVRLLRFAPLPGRVFARWAMAAAEGMGEAAVAAAAAAYDGGDRARLPVAADMVVAAMAGRLRATT